MKITMWYTETYEDGWTGADVKEDFENLAEAWNYFNAYKASHPEDTNLMLCVDGTQIA